MSFFKTLCVNFHNYLLLYEPETFFGGHLAVRVGYLVDFSLGYDELNEKYCQDNGPTAEDPVRMFNYLTYMVWIQQHAFNL